MADKSQRNTTMADVARLAGVGKMTVSRVLTGSASVSRETAERVYRAIRILNYQPNEVARSLRAVSSKTIGVIVPYLFDPFFATCAHAISAVAKAHGYSVILTTSDENPEIEQRETTSMLRRQVDGLVIIPVSNNDRYHNSEAFARVHVVTLDRPASGSRFDSVLVPNRAGSMQAVRHLIGHGHRSIAFLGLSKKLYTMKARYAGYRDAMLEAGHLAAPYVDCESQEKTAALVHAMLDSQQPPTALFAANNLTMRFVLHALSAAGVQIPRQMAIAGFDDFEMADVLQPPLTVIRQPIYELGEVAANLLFERISGSRSSGGGRRVIMPLELVVRRSCGCQPGDPKSGSENASTTTRIGAREDEVAAPAADLSLMV